MRAHKNQSLTWHSLEIDVPVVVVVWCNHFSSALTTTRIWLGTGRLDEPGKYKATHYSTYAYILFMIVKGKVEIYPHYVYSYVRG